MLRTFDRALGQGFLLARPLEAAHLRELLGPPLDVRVGRPT